MNSKGRMSESREQAHSHLSHERQRHLITSPAFFQKEQMTDSHSSISIILNIPTTVLLVSKDGTREELFGMGSRATVLAVKIHAHCLPSKYCFTRQGPIGGGGGSREKEGGQQGATQGDKFYKEKKNL